MFIQFFRDFIKNSHIEHTKNKKNPFLKFWSDYAGPVGCESKVVWLKRVAISQEEGRGREKGDNDNEKEGGGKMVDLFAKPFRRSYCQSTVCV